MAASSTPPHGDPVTQPDPRSEAAQAQERPQAPGSVPAGEPEAPVGPAPTSPPPSSEPGESQDPGEGVELEQPGEQTEHDEQDHEAKLVHDLDELTAKAQKADEYLELAQRTKADFENYRRRAAREVGAAQERGVARLAKELLPAVDNLDRAVDAAQSNGGEDELLAGIKLVHAEVIAGLARAGVERFDPEGETFDPSHHEAVAQQPVEGAQSGTVVEVYQRGYRLGDTVIRPARVLVAA
jgi:molecular chaperone GrpE